MCSHVSNMVNTMYPQATSTVWAHLEAMFLEVSKQLEQEKDAIYDSMYTDYMNVLCGTQIDGMMPKWERMMRGAIAEEVDKTDELFQKLLDGETPDVILGKIDPEMPEEVEDELEAKEAEAVKAESPQDSFLNADVHMVEADNNDTGKYHEFKHKEVEPSTLLVENDMDIDE
jgi:hypothetical protein